MVLHLINGNSAWTRPKTDEVEVCLENDVAGSGGPPDMHMATLTSLVKRRGGAARHAHSHSSLV